VVETHDTVPEVKTWTFGTRVSVTPADSLVSTAGYQLQGFMTVITIEGGRLENKQAPIHISGAGFKPHQMLLPYNYALLPSAATLLMV